MSEHLEQRIIELEAELAALKRRVAPPKVEIVEQGARITHNRASLDNLPDEKQARALLKIVTARHPVLRDDSDEYFSGFIGVLSWCDIEARRIDKLNKKIDVRSFKDEASAWCRVQRLEPPPTVGCFMAAIVAAGVSHSALG